MTTPVDFPKQPLSIAVAELEAPPLSLGNLTWRRFRRHKMAIFGGIVLILLAI